MLGDFDVVSTYMYCVLIINTMRLSYRYAFIITYKSYEGESSVKRKLRT